MYLLEILAAAVNSCPLSAIYNHCHVFPVAKLLNTMSAHKIRQMLWQYRRNRRRHPVSAQFDGKTKPTIMSLVFGHFLAMSQHHDAPLWCCIDCRRTVNSVQSREMLGHTDIAVWQFCRPVFDWKRDRMLVERIYMHKKQNKLKPKQSDQYCHAAYISLDAMLYGGVRPTLPANMARVRCSPDGILSNIGSPRRVTSSSSICWFRFRSRNSLYGQNTI